MDINGGQLTQTSGNPIWAAAQSTGPLTAGNIPHGDGVSALALVGEQVGGTGNAGYCVMGQFSQAVDQATASGAGGFTTQIVHSRAVDDLAVHRPNHNRCYGYYDLYDYGHRE